MERKHEEEKLTSDDSRRLHLRYARVTPCQANFYSFSWVWCWVCICLPSYHTYIWTQTKCIHTWVNHFHLHTLMFRSYVCMYTYIALRRQSVPTSSFLFSFQIPFQIVLQLFPFIPSNFYLLRDVFIYRTRRALATHSPMWAIFIEGNYNLTPQFHSCGSKVSISEYRERND